GNSYAVSINFGSGATRLVFKCPSSIKGIIGYWPCDERFGNTIYDKSPAGNNAIFSGNVARIAGYSAGGLSLDSAKKGHALFSSVPRNVRVDFPFTISLWVKTTAISKGQTILSTEDFYGRYFGAWLDISATGQISFGIGNGGTPSPEARKNKTTTSVLSAGKWNHITAVAKNGSDMVVYINGADAGGSYSGNASSIAHDQYGEFKIGRRISSGNVEQNFEGAVDEVKIFNSALSLEQIQELANDTGSYVQTEKGGIPGRFSFRQSPNPFNPQCKFDLVLPDANEVTLEICDIRGNLINRLIKNQLSAGKHSLVWNALNGNGEKVSAGIYLAKVKVGNDITRTQRLVLTK
ncbi:MAG: T9SS type A sorting domain-containing protein, partial [Fibrobacteres bacterium]|nr:T9SS type A sorting domain-containing protein [Fibrobacterota bacterium]